jgi:hypothetical protein
MGTVLHKSRPAVLSSSLSNRTWKKPHIQQDQKENRPLRGLARPNSKKTLFNVLEIKKLTFFFYARK